MGYSDLVTVRLVLSSDTEETGGTAADLSDDQIQFEIDSASAIIDAELRTKYIVPFDPVPFLIKSICTDIAAYRTDLNFRKSREYDSTNMPIILRYNQALQSLQDLKKGDKTLDSTRSDPEQQGMLVLHQYDCALLNFDSVYEGWPRW